MLLATLCRRRHGRFALRLLTIRDIFRLPNPTWLVDRIIPEFSFVVLFGPPGVGKSFLALDLALALTHTGHDFLGRRTQGGPVVYVAAEGLYTLKSRERAWFDHHQRAPSSTLLHIGEAIQLHQPDTVRRFIKLIEPFKPCLVVFDTLARCAVGIDENKVEGMSQVISGVDKIRLQCQTAVMLIHHSQQLSDENADRIDLLHARGSGSLMGAADTGLRLTGTRHDLTLCCTKQKMAEDFRPISLRLQKIGEAGAIVRYR